MLVYGESDMFRPEHIVEFYHLLGGGLKDAGWGRENMSKNRLAILPDLTHYEIGAAPAFGHAVLPSSTVRAARSACGDSAVRCLIEQKAITRCAALEERDGVHAVDITHAEPAWKSCGQR